jgi:choline dehydrogenase-like flavoprotein
MPCSVAYTPLSKVLTPDECAELYNDTQRLAKRTGRASDALLASQFEPGKTRGQIESLFDLGNWSPNFVSESGKKYATMLQMLQYPFSRGSIHIPPKGEKQKTTVDDKPVIDPQYYLGAGEIDKRIMAKAQRWADRICRTEPLAQIVRGRVFPTPAETSDSEETAYDEFVSNYTITDWHRTFRSPSLILLLLIYAAIGTCAMGGYEGAKAGVVDERLRVYGIRNLRVIDASIMPLQIGAHIQATVYAIAEKGAEMVKEDYATRG